MSSSHQENQLEIEKLRQELEEVKKEKAALEILLEMTTEHTDAAEKDIVQESEKKIDEVKEEKEALEILLEMTTEHTDAAEKDIVQENERKITGFMNAVPVGVFVIDASGKVDFCNKKALELLNKESASDIVAGQVSEDYQFYVTGTDQLYPFANLPSIRALNGESYSVEDIEIHRHDKKIPIEAWGVPIFDNSNKVIYAITAFRDITERKQAEAERERFTRELEILNASLEEKVIKRTTKLQQANNLIRQVFGCHLSTEVVNTLLETKSGLTLGGERREITILTSDLRGFTAQANQLSSEQVIKILNLYLATIGNVVEQFQGSINEFLGDGILIFFGAPVIRENDPERAVACALAMQLAMEDINKKILSLGFPPLEMGIGINTGEVVVGNIGSEKRMKYSAIGNHVNLAYRIESYSVGGEILISESTLNKVKNIVKICSTKTVKLKGISQSIVIYGVEGIGGKYNLYLPKEKEFFLPLLKPISLTYQILEGKQVGKKRFFGNLLKLSAKSALISCEDEKIFLKPMNNLKINLITSHTSITKDDIYAKVLSNGIDENTLYIGFTNIPIKIKARLITICKVEWTSELSVNHPIIDVQHKQILFKLQELVNLVGCYEKKCVIETMALFEEQVLNLFKTEEHLMQQHNYPSYALHQAQHTTFVDTLSDFKQEYEQNQEGLLFLALKIQQTLIDWLINHIIDSDKQFGLFLKK